MIPQADEWWQYRHRIAFGGACGCLQVVVVQELPRQQVIVRTFYSPAIPPRLLFGGWRCLTLLRTRCQKPSSHCLPHRSEQNCHHNHHVPSPQSPGARSDWKRCIPSLHARVDPPLTVVHSNVPLGVFMGQPTGRSAHPEIKGFLAQINVL